MGDEGNVQTKQPTENLMQNWIDEAGEFLLETTTDVIDSKIQGLNLENLLEKIMQDI